MTTTLAKDQPILVNYDYDHGWLIEVPVQYEHGVEYEVAEGHFETGLRNPLISPRANNKQESVRAARALAREHGLKLTIFNCAGMIAAQRLEIDLKVAERHLEIEEHHVREARKTLRRNEADLRKARRRVADLRTKTSRNR